MAELNHIGTTLLGMINTTSHLSTNHQIAVWVLSNLERLDHLSEPEMALACNVSKSSINRFCKELGYANFQRFQLDVLSFRRRYEKKYALTLYDARDPEKSLLDNYTESVARNVRRLAENVDDAVLAQIAADIDAYDQVILVGEQQSGDVACLMQHNLFGAGKVVTSYIYAKEQREVLDRLLPGTLLIVFSLYGNFFHRVLEGAGVSNRPERCKICWITSQPVLPPTIPVDVVIDCGLNKNLAAGNLAMEMVANVIVLHYWRLHHPEEQPGAQGEAR